MGRAGLHRLTAPADGLRASEWTVQTVTTHPEAVGFLIRHHYARGGPNTSTYRHGLYRPPFPPFVGDLLGVALWIPPTRTAAEHVASGDWGGVLSLSRLAVHPECPTNAASFLLAASMRLVDRTRWPVLVTWADTARGHTGAIYRATNWRCDGPVDAGDVWVDKRGRQAGRKRGRFTYTKSEMTELGYVRAAPGQKIRFVHDVRPVYGPRRP